MASIIVPISNLKTPGLTNVKRTVCVDSYLKIFSTETLNVPFYVRHAINGDDISNLIPNQTGMMSASNERRVFVNASGQIESEKTDTNQEMGFFDYILLLQKQFSDEQITAMQIAQLDARNYFDQ
jgi:hypothetical protein